MSRRACGGSETNPPMLRILGNGFDQSIRMIAHALAFALDPESRI